MKIVVAILSIFILALMFTLFYYNPYLTGNTIESGNLTTTGLTIDDLGELRHWDHMPLSYNYSNEEECFPIRISRAELALNEIERLTENQVYFVFTESDADISFVCSRESFVNVVDRTETLGEAEVEYNLERKVITSAKINLYSGVPEECNYPDIEIHELLHALGEGHNTHTQSVMNVVQQKCLKSINMNVDGVIFERLKDTY